MGICVEKLPHSCGSGDGLQVFEKKKGEYDGYCFACGKNEPDPYGDKPAGYEPKFKRKSPEDIKKEVEGIQRYPCVDLPERGLRADSLSYFDIRIGVSESDGETPILHYYPYENKHGELTGYKVRLIEDKRMWAIGSLKGVMPFGWQQALNTGAKKLFITEGEIDAVTLYQVLKDKSKGTKWADYDPAVISLPHGASSAAKALAAIADDIRRNFSEIILVFDMDEAGARATEEAMLVLPEAKTVKLPAKDPNECLTGGREKALANAVLFNSAKPKNTRLVNGATLIEAGRIQAEWGLSWPYKQLTDLTRGVRFGETYYLGAGVKMGKSEVVNDLAKHFIIEHGLKVFMAKPEEANRKTWQMVCGKAVGKIFHDPKVKFDFDAYDKACGLLGDNLVMLDLYQHMGWESLKADIIGAAADGCKIIFIDPITNLTNGINSGEANTVLQAIAQELSAMAHDLGLAIFIFCHLKAPTGGVAHERGGKVESVQFSGSRAMMRSCNYMIGIEGNKDPDLPVELRNIRSLIVLEDREFGSVGRVDLYWDMNTGLFNEI